MRPTVSLAALALLAMALPATAGSIAVQGQGEVSATPDMAMISSGVTTQGATAREALDANSSAMEELMAALEAAGIDARDVQTSNFSVSPNYVYSDARDSNGYTLPPKIQGYQVSNSVSVRVRDIEQLGAILDRSVDVGANTINGISFMVADPTALLDEARKAAFADARRKAELYAATAGEALGELEAITESQGYSSPEPMAMYARADAASVPVAAGEMTFAVNVTVEWSTGNTAD